MKLLITTQAVDKNDPILGFFHRWVEEFAKHFEEIHVICLKEGEHSLPSHVHVHSLGKELKISKFLYVIHFYRYIWNLHGKYDSVFSHMNPHYIVLAGVYWKLCNKGIFFWRNHAKINWMTYVAAWFSQKVFYTSPFACTTRFKHSVQMPVGIDTDYFAPDDNVQPKEKSLLFLGRLSKVKCPELFLETVKPLSGYEAHVYGSEPEGAGEYTAKLKSLAGSNTAFYGSVINNETPKIYHKYEIYVNLTPKGSMDKTILEAASCGTLELVANEAFKEVLPRVMYINESSPTRIRKKIKVLSELSEQEKKLLRTELRDIVIKEHSLKKLMEMLQRYTIS